MRRILVSLVAAAFLLVFGAVDASAAKRSERPAPGSNAYGWTWDHPVAVYDGTGNPLWDVAGAVEKWSVHGLEVYLVSDPAAADIVVTQGDMTVLCGTTDLIIGCAHTTVIDGEPVSGVVYMNGPFGTHWAYQDTLVGGTLHELGHTLGFGHAPLPNSESVMGTPIPANGGARTTLSSFDRGGVRLVY